MHFTHTYSVFFCLFVLVVQSFFVSVYLLFSLSLSICNCSSVSLCLFVLVLRPFSVSLYLFFSLSLSFYACISVFLCLFVLGFQSFSVSLYLFFSLSQSLCTWSSVFLCLFVLVFQSFSVSSYTVSSDERLSVVHAELSRAEDAAEQTASSVRITKAERYKSAIANSDSSLVERRTRGRKIASPNPGRSGGRIFFSRVYFLCWLLFGVHSSPVLPQCYRKRPRSYCQKRR